MLPVEPDLRELRSRLHGVLRQRAGAKIAKGHPDLRRPTPLLVMRKIDDFDEPAVEVERQPLSQITSFDHRPMLLLFWGRRKDIESRRGDDTEILDANATPALEIHPWFNRDDVTWLQDVVRALPQGRKLMNVQPDAMPKPMHELVTVAGSGQRFPGDRVRLSARHGGSDLRECTSLSAQHAYCICR